MIYAGEDRVAGDVCWTCECALGKREMLRVREETLVVHREFAEVSRFVGVNADRESPREDET